MKIKDVIVREDATITKSGPEGVEITAADGVKTILPADKASALAPDPQNQGEYDLNPAAINPGDGQPNAETGPKVGAKVDMKATEGAADGISSMSTSDFVKGVYAVAAEYGGAAPNPEEVKKLMVLNADGDVDIQKTFTKIYQVFNATIPQLEQMLKDIEDVVKSNPELSRMQELAGMTDEDISFNGLTKHDNGDMTYNAGPVSMRQNKDGSSDMTATIGDTTARVQQNPIGVRTLTAQGQAADALVGTDASAERLGVDPRKVRAQIATNESDELEAMLRIAKLR